MTLMGTAGVSQVDVPLLCHCWVDFRRIGRAKVWKPAIDGTESLPGSLAVDRLQEFYLNSTIVAYTTISPVQQQQLSYFGEDNGVVWVYLVLSQSSQLVVRSSLIYLTISLIWLNIVVGTSALFI